MLPVGGHSWQDAGRSRCAPEPKRPTRSPRQAAVLLQWRRPAGRHQTAAPCKYSSFRIGSVWDQHLFCDPVHMPPGQRRWRSCTGFEDKQQCYKGSSKTSARAQVQNSTCRCCVSHKHVDEEFKDTSQASAPAGKVRFSAFCWCGRRLSQMHAMARQWSCFDCPSFGLHPAAEMSTDSAAQFARLIPLDHKGVQRPVSASQYCTSCQHPRRCQQTLSLVRTPASYGEATLHLQHAEVQGLLALGLSRSVCYADLQRMLARAPRAGFPPARQGTVLQPTIDSRAACNF